MPFAVIPDEAERNILDAVRYALGTVKVKLFDNDFTPDAATVIGDLTEASFTGYAAQDFALPTPPTTVGGKAQMDTTIFEFFGPSSGGPVDVYGFFITDSTGVYLLACYRFSDAPRTLTDDTDSCKFSVTNKLFDPHS